MTRGAEREAIGSKQGDEVVHCKASLANDGAKCSGLEIAIAMDWDDDRLGPITSPRQQAMAARNPN